MAQRSTPLTEAEKQSILDAYDQGKSRNTIAAELGFSGYTVSKVVKERGKAFPGAEQTKAKTEAWVKEAAARRQALADKMLSNAERLADSMFSSRVYFDWGGKDHEYDEKEQPEPTDADKLKVAQAVSTSVKAHIDLVKADDKVEVDAAQSMLTGFGKMLGILPKDDDE
jgi:hypothetical protein